MRAALVLLLIAAHPASAGAVRSHTPNWSTRGEKVVCGVVTVWGTKLDPGTQAPLDGNWPGLQCTAAGIPRRRGGTGDPFVQLGQGQAGRARLVDESEDELTSSAPFTALLPGSTWSRDGITCSVASASARCLNSAGHGFRIAPGEVHLF